VSWNHLLIYIKLFFRRKVFLNLRDLSLVNRHRLFEVLQLLRSIRRRTNCVFKFGTLPSPDIHFFNLLFKRRCHFRSSLTIKLSSTSALEVLLRFTKLVLLLLHSTLSFNTSILLLILLELLLCVSHLLLLLHARSSELFLLKVTDQFLDPRTESHCFQTVFFGF